MDSSIGSISHKIPEPIICFEPGRLSPGEPPSTIQPLSIFLFNGALSPYTNVHMHPTCASDQQTNCRKYLLQCESSLINWSPFLGSLRGGLPN